MKNIFRRNYLDEMQEQKLLKIESHSVWIAFSLLVISMFIKSARAALDMTQKDLAEKVGVTRQTISAIEKGDYNPTINLCIQICKVLGKTLDELFWDNE